MIILDGDTEKIQLVLAAAVTTNQLNWTSSWGKCNATGLETYDGGHGNSNSTTDVDVVAGVASRQLCVKAISVYNADTVNATVTAKKDVSGTEYPIFKATLESGETLTYEDGAGWSVSGSAYMPVITSVIHAAGATNFAMSNATQAERFATDDYRHARTVDLAGYTQVRLRTICRVASASANTPLFRIKYYTSFSGVVGNYLQLGESAQVEVAVAAIGAKDTGWMSLAPGARIDGAWIACTEVGGDGAADPALGYTEVLFR